jgi:hypothetical protein
MSLSTLLELLRVHPTLYKDDEHPLNLPQLLLFTSLCHNLRDPILTAQPASQDPSTAPHFLPDSFTFFLSEACKIALDRVILLWTIFRDDVWEGAFASVDIEGVFKEFGHPKDMGASLYSNFHVLLLTGILVLNSVTLAPSPHATLYERHV